jgi:hypothetical protein
MRPEPFDKLRTAPVELRPEPFDKLRTAPVELCPEPFELRPEPVEGCTSAALRQAQHAGRQS